MSARTKTTVSKTALSIWPPFPDLADCLVDVCVHDFLRLLSGFTSHRLEELIQLAQPGGALLLCDVRWRDTQLAIHEGHAQQCPVSDAQSLTKRGGNRDLAT